MIYLMDLLEGLLTSTIDEAEDVVSTTPEGMGHQIL